MSHVTEDNQVYDHGGAPGGGGEEATEHKVRVLQCVAVCRSVSQCVAVCCSVVQCHRKRSACVAVRCSVLQCVAVCCSAMQCDAVCCSVLQCHGTRGGNGVRGRRVAEKRVCTMTLVSIN